MQSEHQVLPEVCAMRALLCCALLIAGCSSEPEGPVTTGADALPSSEAVNSAKIPAGFGNDLPKALAAASAEMKKGPTEAADAVMRLLPESEARWLVAAKRDVAMRARLIAGFSREEGVDLTLQWILKGLEQAQKAKPQMQQGDKVAVFKIKQNAQSAANLEIKFQLVNGHWRFFDNGTGYRDGVRTFAEGGN